MRLTYTAAPGRASPGNAATAIAHIDSHIGVFRGPTIR
jgi:hypothetical protein